MTAPDKLVRELLASFVQPFMYDAAQLTSLLDGILAIASAPAAPDPMREKIVRAAIRVGKAVYSVPQPGRHDDVFRIMPPSEIEKSGPDDQGFLTSTGQFVGRIAACEIAKAAKQIIKKTGGADDLYSEDVW